MNKHFHWLSTQIPHWVKDNIITRKQAQTLLELYPVKDSNSLGRLLITGIGAIMIGLGVILLFAYNWAEMSKYLKLTVIFVAFFGAHLAAFFTMQRNHILSESLFALGTMLMGAAIFLVGQIYHLDSHYPHAFLLWSMGALVLAWVLPSLSQAFIAICLVLGWHVAEVFDFQLANHAAFLVITLGIIPLLWRLNSPVLGRLTSTSLFITVGLSIGSTDIGLVGVTLLLIAIVFIVFDRIIQFTGNQQQKIISYEMTQPALLVFVILLLMMSFGDLINDIILFKIEQLLPGLFFWFSLVLSQLAFGWLIINRQLSALSILAELTALLTLLPNILIYFSATELTAGINLLLVLIFNLILLVCSIWMMIHGARQADRRLMVRGSVLFAILAAARYTDLFDSLIARAVVFLIVGIALFAIGNIYQRHKKEA